MQPLRANLNRTRHLYIADTLCKVDTADPCIMREAGLLKESNIDSYLLSILLQ